MFNERGYMGVIIIAGIAVIALIGIVFIYAQKESSKYEDLLTRVTQLEAEVRAEVQDGNAFATEIEESIHGLKTDVDTLLSKASQVPKPADPLTVQLKQSRPFYVQLVPKDLTPAKKKATPKK
jgi:hypothetical protein